MYSDVNFGGGGGGRTLEHWTKYLDALGNISRVFGYVQVFFSGYVHANLNDIYQFRNSSTPEVVFDDRVLFLIHAWTKIVNLTYIWFGHCFKTWFSNKKSTSYVTVK